MPCLQVFRTRLSPNCRARLTVENDDRPSMYSVPDLMYLHKLIGIPIVFDFHHHKFCTGEAVLILQCHCGPHVLC